MNNEIVYTPEELALKNDIETLWTSLYPFTRQQAYRFSVQYNKRCQSAGITFDDLIQQAYLILCKAIEMYKLGEYKFITYYGKTLLYGYLRLISHNRKKALNYCTSLNVSLDSDDDNSDTLIDLTPDPNGEAEIDKTIEAEYQRELKRDIQSVLNTLPNIERDVIHERFWNRNNYDDIGDKVWYDTRKRTFC